jgi:hypothetical protein
MYVTLLGIVTDVRPVQPLKALLPIVVTLLGMDVFLHPRIRVFVAVSINALHPPLESKVLLPSATFILIRFSDGNPFLPIEVRLLGNVIEVKLHL